MRLWIVLSARYAVGSHIGLAQYCIADVPVETLVVASTQLVGVLLLSQALYGTDARQPDDAVANR